MGGLRRQCDTEALWQGRRRRSRACRGSATRERACLGLAEADALLAALAAPLTRIALPASAVRAPRQALHYLSLGAFLLLLVAPYGSVTLHHFFDYRTLSTQHFLGWMTVIAHAATALMGAIFLGAAPEK